LMLRSLRSSRFPQLKRTIRKRNGRIANGFRRIRGRRGVARAARRALGGLVDADEQEAVVAEVAGARQRMAVGAPLFQEVVHGLQEIVTLARRQRAFGRENPEPGV